LADRYLNDALWLAVAPVLPGKIGDPGCSGRDNRAFLEAVFWIVRTQSPWRDLPPEFGKWYTTYTRFNRWAKKGVWPGVISALEAAGCHDFSFDTDGLHWTPSGEFTAGQTPRKAGGRAAA
jgi:transposase